MTWDVAHLHDHDRDCRDICDRCGCCSAEAHARCCCIHCPCGEDR